MWEARQWGLEWIISSGKLLYIAKQTEHKKVIMMISANIYWGYTMCRNCPKHRTLNAYNTPFGLRDHRAVGDLPCITQLLSDGGVWRHTPKYSTLFSVPDGSQGSAWHDRW